MLELKTPALLIIDMQNGFCRPEGTFGKLGMLTSPNSLLAIVPAINRLRAAAHAAKIPVIFTRFELKADYSDAGIQLDDLPLLKELSGFVKDSWDAQVLDGLKLDSETEIDLPKTRNTAFWKTGLEEKLRGMKVDQLIVTGVGTNVCVESTVRDAVTRDFYVKTVRDATACLTMEEHEASLRNLHWYGGVTTTDEVCAALEELDRRE